MTPEAQSAVLRALRFDGGPHDVVFPPSTDWKAVLAYCDRFQLTLALARRDPASPDWVRARLEQNVAANRIRLSNALAAYNNVAHALGEIEHLVLKGFTLAPDFCPSPDSRVHYDLDLFCRYQDIRKARDAVASLGYEPLGGTEHFPTDHLPTMILKTGWQWRGDYFDTTLPVSIELHFRFWDRQTERFGPEDLNGFWDRRRPREIQGVPFHSLAEADALAYACLHALRHLLRGDSRPSHFYEIGYFLQGHRDAAFWEQWQQLYSPELRRLQAICFCFAEQWFGCTVVPVPRAEMDALPDDIKNWFARWGRAPLDKLFHPNKNELWLHLSLLESWTDKASVLRRRLIPLTAPGPVDAVHIPDSQMTFARRLRKHWRYVSFATQRVIHHTRVLLPTVATGFSWYFSRHGLSPQFWRFFRGFVIFNVALMVYFLLFNLHLVGLGFKEDLIGKVASAMTLGNLLGSVIAGLAVARIGLRSSLIFCFVSQGALLAMRVFATTPLPLLVISFAGGISHSFYAVALAPTVAALTGERNRPFAFSLTMATGISLGMVAGLAGGKLPALLHSTQNVLWLSCALAATAAIPLFRLHLGTTEARSFHLFRPSAFLVRLLGALSLWGLATGAFNPFFNVYFLSAMHFRVETIGLLFTTSQFSQVAAMLLSPLVLKRLGLLPGIAAMQAATGLALGGLGLANPPMAVLLYPLYMAFQYMSEPGIFSLLMSGVSAEERTGASASYFAVAFCTQALAAWVSGAAIARFGYTPVLLSAGALALVAARTITWVTRSVKAANG